MPSLGIAIGVDMRKLGTTALAVMVALILLVIGSPPASAFGSEVLGCAFDTASWQANQCAGGETIGSRSVIHYAAHNLSGTYSKQWTITNDAGNAVTATCSSTVTGNCISSGCTTSSTTCDIMVIVGAELRRYTASLRLTQSGLTRTIQAVGVVYAGDPACLPRC
jgi:hypothetical protein